MDSVSINRMDARVNRLGSSLFFAPTTIETAASNGVTDLFGLYVAGRVGVMGDVLVDQACSAFCFISPDMIRGAWPGVEMLGGPSAGTALFVRAMTETVRLAWDPAASAVVAAIGRRVVRSVTPMGMALFAGWRQVDAGSDPFRETVLVVHSLRELRGDIHVQSVAAEGLRPLDADFASRGEVVAELHGWPKPYPDAAAFATRVAAAEASTSARMERVYRDELTPAEFGELDAALGVLAAQLR